MKEPTSRFGCFDLNCEACHGDKEWQDKMTREWLAEYGEPGELEAYLDG
jgi:hypothetical protein